MRFLFWFLSVFFLGIVLGAPLAVADLLGSLETVSSVVDKVTNPTTLGTAAIVLETVFRFVPTTKPLSILYMVAKFFGLFGKVCTKTAEGLDKVLPQKRK